MAPLKRPQIEAHVSLRQRYPWLRGHGFIEAFTRWAATLLGSMYPWLRGHGSIEAPDTAVSDVGNIVVSMAERSWLH